MRDGSNRDVRNIHAGMGRGHLPVKWCLPFPASVQALDNSLSSYSIFSCSHKWPLSLSTSPQSSAQNLEQTGGERETGDPPPPLGMW